MSNKTTLHPVDADRLVFSNLLIRQIIGKAQDSNLCGSRNNSTTSTNSCFSSSAPATSEKRTLLFFLSTGFALALLGWYLLPFPLEYRQALVMCTLAPIASTAPAFTAELKGDFGLSSAVNSISILISIVLITGSLLLILV